MARQSQTQNGQSQEQSQPAQQEHQSQPGARSIPDRNLPGEPQREREDDQSRGRAELDEDVERGRGPERQARAEPYTTF